MLRDHRRAELHPLAPKGSDDIAGLGAGRLREPVQPCRVADKMLVHHEERRGHTPRFNVRGGAAGRNRIVGAKGIGGRSRGERRTHIAADQIRDLGQGVLVEGLGVLHLVRTAAPGLKHCRRPQSYEAARPRLLATSRRSPITRPSSGRVPQMKGNAEPCGIRHCQAETEDQSEFGHQFVNLGPVRIRKMARYCVNPNAQVNGDHEVHRQGCTFWPKNPVDLGEHANCQSAVRQAKATWPTSRINGCKFCSPECHTS